MFTELITKQLTEQRRQELEPQRALYSSSAINLEPIEVKPEPQRPILCDECGKRAGAIGSMLFFCAPCEIFMRVHHNLGRVTFTPAQFAETLGVQKLDLEKLELESRESSALEPLDPAEY
jgi:hypothetical protein